MKVGIGILWHVIVEYDVHTLNVHATSKQVGGDQDTLLEILELLVPAQKDDVELLGKKIIFLYFIITALCCIIYLTQN